MSVPMSLKDHVKGRSSFKFYRSGIVYYLTDTGLEFPVPIDDLDGASVTASEKSLYFMRWIKKHLKTLEDK